MPDSWEVKEQHDETADIWKNGRIHLYEEESVEDAINTIRRSAKKGDSFFVTEADGYRRPAETV